MQGGGWRTASRGPTVSSVAHFGVAIPWDTHPPFSSLDGFSSLFRAHPGVGSTSTLPFGGYEDGARVPSGMVIRTIPGLEPDGFPFRTRATPSNKLDGSFPHGHGHVRTWVPKATHATVGAPVRNHVDPPGRATCPLGPSWRPRRRRGRRFADLGRLVGSTPGGVLPGRTVQGE